MRDLKNLIQYQPSVGGAAQIKSARGRSLTDKRPEHAVEQAAMAAADLDADAASQQEPQLVLLHGVGRRKCVLPRDCSPDQPEWRVAAQARSPAA